MSVKQGPFVVADQSSMDYNPEVRSALLRDQIAAAAHGLSEIELRYIAQEMGLAREGDPKVIKYPGYGFKLSTDPPEMLPYTHVLTYEQWIETLKQRSDDIDTGKSKLIPSAEALERIRKLTS